MKRLVVCCDGTWNKLGNYPTNPVKIARLIRPFDQQGVAQIVFYQEGLGTKWYDRLPGGAFGWGIDYNIESAYQFLCFNYEPGDEIYLFGFSRGAYTVRSLAGMLYCSGLLRRQHVQKVPQAYKLYRDRAIRPGSSEAEEFRKQYCIRYKGDDQIPITLLGCWDTVGSLGVPNLLPWLPFGNLLNRKYKFHDTKLNRKIRNALHAVAVDERRKVFDVAPMELSPDTNTQRLRQMWFPGVHGCVGGGTEKNCLLSDCALLWMIEAIAEYGLKLEFDQERVKQEVIYDPLIDFQPNSGLFALAGLHDRPIQDGFAVLHDSTKKRWRERSDYRPENLIPFESDFRQEWESERV